MSSHYKMIIIGVACLSTCLPLRAATQGDGTVKLTMHLTNATIAINDTIIPATVTIENTTEDSVMFYFNSSLLMCADFESVEFVVPATGKVRVRPRGFLPSIELQLITLEPGGKYIGDVNLGRFIEVTDTGEYDVGLKINLKYYRTNDEMVKRAARTISRKTAIKLNVERTRTSRKEVQP